MYFLKAFLIYKVCNRFHGKMQWHTEVPTLALNEEHISVLENHKCLNLFLHLLLFLAVTSCLLILQP